MYLKLVSMKSFFLYFLSYLIPKHCICSALSEQHCSCSLSTKWLVLKYFLSFLVTLKQVNQISLIARRSSFAASVQMTNTCPITRLIKETLECPASGTFCNSSYTLKFNNSMTQYDVTWSWTWHKRKSCLILRVFSLWMD